MKIFHRIWTAHCSRSWMTGARRSYMRPRWQGNPGIWSRWMVESVSTWSGRAFSSSNTAGRPGTKWNMNHGWADMDWDL